MKPCHPVEGRWREWLAGSCTLGVLQGRLLYGWMKRRCCACSSQLDRTRCNARPLSCTTPAGEGADAVRVQCTAYSQVIHSADGESVSQSVGRSVSHGLCRQPMHHHCRKMIEGLWGWTTRCRVVLRRDESGTADCEGEGEGEGGACLPPASCHLFRWPSLSTVPTCP